jgi:hypothetical protein
LGKAPDEVTLAQIAQGELSSVAGSEIGPGQSANHDAGSRSLGEAEDDEAAGHLEDRCIREECVARLLGQPHQERIRERWCFQALK